MPGSSPGGSSLTWGLTPYSRAPGKSCSLQGTKLTGRCWSTGSDSRIHIQKNNAGELCPHHSLRTHARKPRRKGNAIHTSVSCVSCLCVWSLLLFVSGLCSAPPQLFWGHVIAASALHPPIPFSQVCSYFSITPPTALESSGHVPSPQTQGSLSSM